MLIATTNVDINKCFGLSNNKDELDKYIESLVPEKYRHISAIIGNQRYYINCRMFESREHSIDEKRDLSNMLMLHVRVAGLLGSFVTVTELEGFIDKDLVAEYREGNKV